MTMAALGYAKLIEELGELAQVCGKRLAYYTTDDHPDGKGSLRERLESEMADVLAAINLVAENEGLDLGRINDLSLAKWTKFLVWDEDPDNNREAIDGSG